MHHHTALPHRKSPVTWFLVADGRNAQAYVRSRVERVLPQRVNPPLPYEEFWQNTLVPVAEISLKAKHDEPHPTSHDATKGNFIKTIAAKLSVAKTKHLFDRLILVAPAKTLGELKKSLSPKVRMSVVAELPKELAGCEESTLLHHLMT